MPRPEQLRERFRQIVERAERKHAEHLERLSGAAAAAAEDPSEVVAPPGRARALPALRRPRVGFGHVPVEKSARSLPGQRTCAS